MNRAQAPTVARLGLNYVVITPVDRDDLRDGGAAHFAAWDPHGAQAIVGH